MNASTPHYLAALALCLVLGEARAEYWAVDELVKDFGSISLQIGRGELPSAEADLAALQQRVNPLDVRIEQYQRELAAAYLQQGQQQLAAGNPAAAGVALTRAKPYMAVAPGLSQAYQASLAAIASGGSPASAHPAQTAVHPQPLPTLAQQSAPALPGAAQPETSAQQATRRQAVERRLQEVEAIIASKEAQRVQQRQLAEAQASAALAARAQQAAEQPKQAAPAPVTAEAQGAQPVAAAVRARLIDPAAASSSVPMPMLDANDRDSLRTLLDAVAADVVTFDCAVRLQVREARDYPLVAALLSARIKKLAPDFSPQLSPVLKPDQQPRLVLSPQSNG